MHTKNRSRIGKEKETLKTLCRSKNTSITKGAYDRVKSSWKENGYLILACVIMVGLFYSSSMSYEQQSVTPLLNRLFVNEPLKQLLAPVRFGYAGKEISIHALGYSAFIEFFLRKGAHFFIYFLLGLSWFMGLKEKLDSVPLALFLAFLLAAGYASFDEFHQGLTPGRTPLLEDIYLDWAGAATGILMSWLFTSRKKTRYRRR